MKRVIASQLTREWISGISKTNVFIEYHSHLVITNAEALTQGIKRVASTLGGPVSEIKIDARWLGSSLRAHLLNQTPFMSDSPKITNEEGQETDVDYAVFVHANGNPLPDTQFLRLVDQINRSLSATYFPGRQRDKPYLFFRHPNYLFRARSSLGESTFSLQLDISLKNCAPAGYQYGPTIFGIMASDSHLEYLDSFAPLHITEHIFFLPYNSAPDYTLLFRFLKSTRRIIQPYLFDVMLASVIVTATNTDPSTHCRKQLDQLSEDNLAQLSCNTNALTAFTKHAHRSSLLLGNMTDLSKIILTYEKNDLPPTNGRTKKELQAAIVKAFSEFESYIKDRKASPHFERLVHEFRQHLLYAVAFLRLQSRPPKSVSEYVASLNRILNREFTEDEARSAAGLSAHFDFCVPEPNCTIGNVPADPSAVDTHISPNPAPDQDPNKNQIAQSMARLSTIGRSKTRVSEAENTLIEVFKLLETAFPPEKVHPKGLPISVEFLNQLHAHMRTIVTEFNMHREYEECITVMQRIKAVCNPSIPLDLMLEKILETGVHKQMRVQGAAQIDRWRKEGLGYDLKSIQFKTNSDSTELDGIFPRSACETIRIHQYNATRQKIVLYFGTWALLSVLSSMIAYKEGAKRGSLYCLAAALLAILFGLKVDQDLRPR